MPIQLIVTEGLLDAAAEQAAFAGLTDLLLRLHGLTGNAFMTPGVVGEVTVVPRGRTFMGGRPADIAIFELKAPAFVLPTQEIRDAWVREGTDLIERLAQGRLRREAIFANFVHAVDGAWGIAGVAHDNPALGAKISAAATAQAA